VVECNLAKVEVETPNQLIRGFFYHQHPTLRCPLPCPDKSTLKTSDIGHEVHSKQLSNYHFRKKSAMFDNLSDNFLPAG